MPGLLPGYRSAYLKHMFRVSLALIPFFIAACAEVPTISPERSDLAAPEGYPLLEPLAPILAQIDAASAPDDALETLNARAARLSGRSAGVALAAPSADRIAQLRARAAILRGDATDLDALRLQIRNR